MSNVILLVDQSASITTNKQFVIKLFLREIAMIFQENILEDKYNMNMYTFGTHFSETRIDEPNKLLSALETKPSGKQDIFEALQTLKKATKKLESSSKTILIIVSDFMSMKLQEEKENIYQLAFNNKENLFPLFIHLEGYGTQVRLNQK